MKLGQIIKYLDVTSRVKLFQADLYTDEDEPELVFEGFIMDIPWVYLDYFLVNDSDGEAIEARLYEDNKAGFIICVKEKE